MVDVVRFGPISGRMRRIESYRSGFLRLRKKAVLARQEEGPGLKPLNFMGFIQWPEGPCSLRKAKTNNGKSNDKSNDKGTQFWLLASHPSLKKAMDEVPAADPRSCKIRT